MKKVLAFGVIGAVIILILIRIFAGGSSDDTATQTPTAAESEQTTLITAKTPSPTPSPTPSSPLSPTSARASGVGTANEQTSSLVQNCDENGTCYLTTQINEARETSQASTTAVRRPSFAGFGVPEGFFQNLEQLFDALLKAVMAISLLLVFLYLIWGGLNWITSGGDKGKIDQAKQKIISAVIGLVVVAASYAILTIMINFLGLGTLNDVINQAMSGNSAPSDTSGSLGEVSQQELE